MGTSSRGFGFRRAIEQVLPAERFGDERTILAGAGQNVVGLVVAMVATLATQVLITRVLGAAAFGVVTVATQAAFILAAATRVGMDHASVRRVAIEVGAGERSRVRAIVNRAAWIAGVVSVGFGVLMFIVADPLGRAFTTSPNGRVAFQAAALTLPFAGLVQVYLGATRGLKIMRHTLYVFWMGQPVAWILLMAIGWAVSRSIETSVLTYGLSWLLAAVAAAWAWRRETAEFGHDHPHPGEVGALLRFGGPRAPAALFAQALFWLDLFVLARYATSAEVGVYAAAVRAGQVILLFQISVSYMFSPFVADLFERGQREQLDRLYKLLTRWTVTVTLPVLIVLAVAPDTALRLFGANFGGGSDALLILVAGQVVRSSAGAVGFMLIMVGRTGWDLIVYAASVTLDVGVAVLLVPSLGIEGAATAGALTLGLSNLARLWLIWRFVRVQPFTRDYVRLILPVGLGFLAAGLAHLVLDGLGWQLDLVGTTAAALLGYAIGLLAGGLPPGERRALLRMFGGLRNKVPLSD
ncbi:MAG: oligosaccharide flippase family protein [Actinomycetota bacterium]